MSSEAPDVLRYVWRDLVRNPRRTLSSLAGVVLGVGLFSGVLFFNDGSAASLTRRAIAPLVLDMQRVLTSPLGRPLRFDERLAAPSPLLEGQDVQFTLTAENRGAAPANEVVINDEPPPPLAYVLGTTTLNGEPLADVIGQSPLAQGLARTGLNIGTVAPGATVTLTYVARANRTVDDSATLRPGGTISTREDVVPAPANAPELLGLAQLTAAIGRLPGVAAADGLSFVDLPPGSLRTDRSTIDKPVRLFAFTPQYQLHHPSIRLVAGSFADADDTDAAAVLSAEAARALAVEPGAIVTLTLSGSAEQTTLPVSGVADLARATPLFASRKSRKLEDFLYRPHSIVVSPATFERIVIAAFRAAGATQGTLVRTIPVLEVDVQVDRSRLRADPARSLAQTQAIAASIVAIGPGQDYLIDNISNALDVARNDAALGRRMFVFVGLPAVALAAFGGAYAGGILAATQRRDNANLRLRGASRRHLTRIVSYRTAILASVGSIAGAAFGFVAVLVLMGTGSLAAASRQDLLISAAMSLAIGMLVVGVALYLPARRSLRQDITIERRELSVELVPVWRRWRLDIVFLAGAAVIEAIAFRFGAFDAALTSVSLGQSPSLPSPLLLVPLVAWFGGTLLAVRGAQAFAAHVCVTAAPTFGPLIRGTLTRSLRRRSRAAATGIAAVCLVTAFGSAIVIFAATYDAAKARDARFVVGGDLRITPSVVSEQSHPPSYASTLMVPGVARVSPVVYRLENAVLIGAHEQDRADLAAIDAATFADVAPLSVATTALTKALEATPNGVLIAAEKADSLSIETGDHVKVLLARGTEAQRLEDVVVVGRFVRLPGFPRGVDVVINLSHYERATGLHATDFFLARTTGRTDAAAAALAAGPGADDPLHIDSTTTTIDKDQSSLTAFDLRGLVRLDVGFSALMSVAGVTMFVFGLVLHRRREYVILRAQGMVRRELRALLLSEAGLVALGGVLAGVLTGVLMGRLFVYVLRPLFVLDPGVTLPTVQLALLAATPIVVAMVASLIAAAMLARIEPFELLRET